jgi:NAD(P)-dependent dehydrogenase (short-subunit alcohol dehydrogenase family)
VTAVNSLVAGKVALVTGSSKGIGRALAVGLAEHGAAVAVHYKIDRAGALETCELIDREGGTSVAVGADVSDPVEARRLVAQARAELGGLHILVNNAARTRFGPPSEVTDEDWDDVVGTNLRGPFVTSIAAAESMEDGGSIINMSSCAASLMIRDHSLYTAAKGGLEALTRQLAFEYAPRIRVNAIAPAPTGTTRAYEYDPRYDEKWGAVIPLGRVGRPEDYVGSVVFLASGLSAFMTGEVLHVDGGWTLKGDTPALVDNFSRERERG